MQDQPRAVSIVRAVLGLVLIVGGVALMFLPGPGALTIVFGLGLIAGMSRALACWMDNTELSVRRGLRTLKRKFRPQ